MLTPTQIEAAREWLMDCIWADMEPEDFAEVSDDQVVRAIRRFYDGGIEEFLRTF